MRKLRRESSIEPSRLCLGQGLGGFEQSIRVALCEAGFGAVTPFRALETHASKVEAMGGHERWAEVTMGPETAAMGLGASGGCPKSPGA